MGDQRIQINRNMIICVWNKPTDEISKGGSSIFTKKTGVFGSGTHFTDWKLSSTHLLIFWLLLAHILGYYVVQQFLPRSVHLQFDR